MLNASDNLPSASTDATTSYSILTPLPTSLKPPLRTTHTKLVTDIYTQIRDLQTSSANKRLLHVWVNELPTTPGVGYATLLNNILGLPSHHLSLLCSVFRVAILAVASTNPTIPDSSIEQEVAGTIFALLNNLGQPYLATTPPVYNMQPAQHAACLQRQGWTCQLSWDTASLTTLPILPVSTLASAISGAAFWAFMTLSLGLSLSASIASLAHSPANALLVGPAWQTHLGSGNIILRPINPGAGARGHWLDVQLVTRSEKQSTWITHLPAAVEEQVKWQGREWRYNINAKELREIQSGDVVRLTTADPVKHPLPHPLLLQLREMFFTIATFAGPAELGVRGMKDLNEDVYKRRKSHVTPFSRKQSFLDYIISPSSRPTDYEYAFADLLLACRASGIQPLPGTQTDRTQQPEDTTQFLDELDKFQQSILMIAPRRGPATSTTPGMQARRRGNHTRAVGVASSAGWLATPMQMSTPINRVEGKSGLTPMGPEIGGRPISKLGDMPTLTFHLPAHLITPHGSNKNHDNDGDIDTNVANGAYDLQSLLSTDSQTDSDTQELAGDIDCVTSEGRNWDPDNCTEDGDEREGDETKDWARTLPDIVLKDVMIKGDGKAKEDEGYGEDKD